jgi:6-phosphofructokinase 1
MKRLGILTGGGDAPGLNAVLRAETATRTLRRDLGIEDGYDGWCCPTAPARSPRRARLIGRGGTIRHQPRQPLARRVTRNGECD